MRMIFLSGLHWIYNYFLANVISSFYLCRLIIVIIIIIIYIIIIIIIIIINTIIFKIKLGCICNRIKWLPSLTQRPQTIQEKT